MPSIPLDLWSSKSCGKLNNATVTGNEGNGNLYLGKTTVTMVNNNGVYLHIPYPSQMDELNTLEEHCNLQMEKT